MSERSPAGLRVFRIIWPWLLVAALGLVGFVIVRAELRGSAGVEPIVWRSPRALVLLAGAALVGFVSFHLRRRRVAAMGFSQVGLVGARGTGTWLADLPAVLRVLALVLIVVGLARPETYRTVVHTEDSIDIMIVFDMSKSMEETDLPRDRMDAAQRVVRRFVRRTRHDRIGLVIFGQQAMLQCPLTSDTKLVEQIVSDLRIGDVPELGTAIGDGLGMAVASLRRSDAKSKVVVLLSDGDNNSRLQFEPEEAAQVAKQYGIKVYTVLVGREEADFFGGMSVNPETLRQVASITGGEFFRATDYDSFDRGFRAVRAQLDTTKRERRERIPDKQLFVLLVGLAAALLVLELILSHTRLRRLP